MQQITTYGSTAATPEDSLNHWHKLADYRGTYSYNPVAVMILPAAKTVRHLAVRTGHSEGILSLKEVQVFGCLSTCS